MATNKAGPQEISTPRKRDCHVYIILKESLKTLLRQLKQYARHLSVFIIDATERPSRISLHNTWQVEAVK